MSRITFYEKPGCSGNARQKDWLRAAGHQLEVRNLLTEPWSRERLLEFLGPLPVTAWFNRAAPAVRDGHIVPELLSPEPALALLLANPLLIRRPLLEDAAGHRVVGFDPVLIDTWIGLAGSGVQTTRTEGCVAASGPCVAPHSN